MEQIRQCARLLHLCVHAVPVEVDDVIRLTFSFGLAQDATQLLKGWWA